MIEYKLDCNGSPMDVTLDCSVVLDAISLNWIEKALVGAMSKSASPKYSTLISNCLGNNGRISATATMVVPDNDKPSGMLIKVIALDVTQGVQNLSIEFKEV